MRTAVAERLVRHALGGLPVRVRLAGRETIGQGGPLMDVRNPAAFFRRIGARGLLGFGESYMAGEWEAPDLVGLLTVFAENAATLVPGPLQRLGGGRGARPAGGAPQPPNGPRAHHSQQTNRD
ncbi:SAM-dependent methyltransferase, partial [Streptomyces sp. NPDC058572]